MKQATPTTQKPLTNQTRRHAMQARKLTFVSLLIVAVIIGGCSNQNTVTGPEINPDETLTSTQPAENDQLLTKALQSATPRRSFDAVMHRVDIEGGCWYLETEKGEKFEPYFEDGESIRYEGMELHAYGYEDRSLATICMIAPVFRIEKHEILSKGDNDKKTPELNNSAISQVSTDDRKHVAVTGIITQEDYPDGCIYLKSDRDGAFELEFKAATAVSELSKGSIKAIVAGWINPNKQSKCPPPRQLSLRRLNRRRRIPNRDR